MAREFAIDPRPATPRASRRRGMLLIELMMASIVIGGLLFMAVGSLGWIVHARRAADQRVAALEEAANLLDQLTNLSWSELNAERVEKIALSPETQAILPDAKLAIALGEPPLEAAPAAKRISVAIVWNDRSGLPDAPVRLTAWKYRRLGE